MLVASARSNPVTFVWACFVSAVEAGRRERGREPQLRRMQDLQGVLAEAGRGGAGARYRAGAGGGRRDGLRRGDREGAAGEGGGRGRRRGRGPLRRGQGHRGAARHALGLLRREVSAGVLDLGTRGSDLGLGRGADVPMRRSGFGCFCCFGSGSC